MPAFCHVMDDNAPKENPPADFNKLDLSQLQGFSFGTQWTQDKSSPSERRERREGGDDRPRRDDRRDGGGGAPMNRDRRSFRRPAGAPGGDAGPAGGAPTGGQAPAGAPVAREFSGDRRPRTDGPGGGGGGGPYRGGPRRDGPAGGPGGGQRYERGGQGGGGGYGGQGGYGRGAPQDRGPYDSPYYSVTFYPEDTSFNTLVQTIRKSCRTVELFEIARTVVAKTDRFVVVVAHKATAATDTAPGAAKPAKPAFYLSVPDGMPFESDEAAVAHVLSNHLDKFFDTAEVEVDPPKGNFQVINKCGVTGELLGPPNYHRYNQIVQQHHAAKVSRMSLESFRSQIITVRDPEVVNQWLAKMKKTTRFTWKNPSSTRTAAATVPASASGANPAAAPEAPAASTPAAIEAPAAAPAEASPAEAVPTDGVPAESAATATPEAAAPATAPDAAAPALSTVPTFDTHEDARMYLLTQVRDKVVRAVENARVHGKVAEQLPPGEIRRAVEGALERQRRFPLDTANALRGRLRREHFTIFKKGSKGISYVCAVKRKFRVPGQTFSDSIGSLISFIETNPMIRASELQSKFLGLAPAPKAPEAPAASEGTSAPDASAAPAAEPAKAEPMLTIEERAKISRLQGDLMWLVREGYVTEFIDGRLFAPPPMVEARKKEVEAEEHDPENFPDVPANESSEARTPRNQPAAATPLAASPDAESSESAEPAPAADSSALAEPASDAPAPEASTDAPTDAPADDPKPTT